MDIAISRSDIFGYTSDNEKPIKAELPVNAHAVDNKLTAAADVFDKSGGVEIIGNLFEDKELPLPEEKIIKLVEECGDRYRTDILVRPKNAPAEVLEQPLEQAVKEGIQPPCEEVKETINKDMPETVEKLGQEAKKAGESTARTLKSMSKTTKGLLAALGTILVAAGGIFIYNKHGKKENVR